MKAKILYPMLLIGMVLSGCTSNYLSKNSIELTKGIEKSKLSPVEITAPEYEEINPREEITGFSLNLFRENFKGENILISPLSIISALGMTANGAENETLSQMEKAFGTDLFTLNNYLKSYVAFLPMDKNNKVNVANSIWFKDSEGLSINKEFLGTVRDYYEASVFKAPFDKSTKGDINAWVNEETQKIIPKILDEVPPKEAVMYLINALSFDAQWEEVYKDIQIQEGEFTASSGKKQKVEFMNSSENTYLETEDAIGFMKPYSGGKYAFVALLPKEKMEMEVFLKNLDGDGLMKTLKNKQQEEVIVNLPKFSTQYHIQLNDSLKALGMTDAFDPDKADFSALGQSSEGNISISKVIHQTKIDVQEKGTRAGAVTVVALETTGMSPDFKEPKYVCLDRPFFYMIVDTQQNFPLFMGCLMSMEE